MTAPIPHIIRQQTGPLDDRHVTQYWLSDGTCLRSEARTPDTANLNVAWAYFVAAERARFGGEVPEPFVPSGPVAYANPRDMMLLEMCELLDTYAEELKAGISINGVMRPDPMDAPTVELIDTITDLTRRARVDLHGPIGPATSACTCNPPEGDTHQTWCPEGPGAMYA
ncbi:hypothetical protein [Falsirhodobacter halotolerans]|uniref:hypothetical protein n=1 Tax=Falsirhodobacter halotolerans TaxID=1146892 RepID=UPI001FD57409|nr:hypothetical protein [Falsirhodobacter halotolerans]MCJ8138406.1 hypothetical protein [Falsirhodobacter halotolerans]